MSPSPVTISFDWVMPVEVRYGVGTSDELDALLGDRRALVLAFAQARALGLQTKWQDQLGERLAAWVDVPDGLSSVAMARELALRVWPLLAEQPELVIVAVGGGSTLDLAKILRCRPRDGGFASLAAALRGQAPWPETEQSTLWLLPTTAGTGSEVTRWATVWDTDTQPAVKRSFDEPFGYATRAIVAPALTLSCPPRLSRDCALDALAHSLEAMWNRHANPISDRLAMRAAQRIVNHLPASLEQPSDLALRCELSLAALEAGLAFSQTRTALAHALSYVVTLEQGLPHGLACALWLPTAWQLAEGCDARLDALLHQVFASADALQDWLGRVGAGATPQQLGIADVPARVAGALASPRGRNFIAAP